MTTIDHQHVDIYDVRGRPRSGFKNSEHLNKYPDIEPLDRLVFRNGVLHDTLLGKAAFYEALVHPALFLHDSPKRVAILGGGNGATLREVLKHETIEHVVVVNVDGGFVDFSRQYLHEWSQCGDLHGSAEWSSCFEDRRVTLHFGGPIEWILEKNQAGIDRYDAIIIDSVYDAEPWTTLKHERDPLVALYELLSSDGIFVTDAEITRSGGRAATFFMNRLRMAGFENAVKYEEAHTRMGTPSSSFLLVMKSIDSRSVWYADESVWNLRIHQRSVRLHDGHLPFRYFDSGTMMGYQFPSKLEQEVWCKGRADHCNDLKPVFDPEIDNVAPSDLSVKPSLVAKGERGIFTEKHIPKGSYMALNECAEVIYMAPLTVDAARPISEGYKVNSILGIYGDVYGWDDDFYGPIAYVVDSGRMTFSNHGCNGTFNFGALPELTESVRIPSEDDLHEMNEIYHDTFFYNPYSERSHGFGNCQKEVALRDIEDGEELLCNYLDFIDDLGEAIRTIGDICSGTMVGEVTTYENSVK